MGLRFPFRVAMLALSAVYVGRCNMSLVPPGEDLGGDLLENAGHRMGYIVDGQRALPLAAGAFAAVCLPVLMLDVKLVNGQFSGSLSMPTGPALVWRS